MKFFRSTIIISAFAFATSFASSLVMAKDYEMEDIMKKGMKGDDSLVKKIVEGRASDEEKALFTEYCEALGRFLFHSGAVTPVFAPCGVWQNTQISAVSVTWLLVASG